MTPRSAGMPRCRSCWTWCASSSGSHCACTAIRHFSSRRGKAVPSPQHQDNAHFGVDPSDWGVTAWCALDDATVANGCMQYFSGSHLKGAVPHVWRGGTTHLVPQEVDLPAPVHAPVQCRGRDLPPPAHVSYVRAQHQRRLAAGLCLPLHPHRRQSRRRGADPGHAGRGPPAPPLTGAVPRCTQRGPPAGRSGRGAPRGRPRGLEVHRGRAR